MKGEQKALPVKAGNVYKLTCEAIGEKGDGIFRKDGFVVMAPESIVGKEYLIKVKNVLSKVAFGEIVSSMEEEEDDY